MGSCQGGKRDRQSGGLLVETEQASCCAAPAVIHDGTPGKVSLTDWRNELKKGVELLTSKQGNPFHERKWLENLSFFRRWIPIVSAFTCGWNRMADSHLKTHEYQVLQSPWAQRGRCREEPASFGGAIDPEGSLCKVAEQSRTILPLSSSHSTGEPSG